MRIIVKKTAQDFDRAMALLIAAELNAKPNINLGMATGTTTQGIYAELVKLYQEGLISFRDAHLFNVDVSSGFALDHPKNSGYQAMKQQLFDHVDLPLANGHFPDSGAADGQKAMDDYIDLIESYGGLDVQVLPLGENGHIGFCQPGTPLNSTRLLCDLPSEYVRDIDGVHIYQGLTLGLADIMHARKLIFCAKTPRKAAIVARALKGPVNEDCPASIVQLHPNVVAVLDEDAAAQL